MQLFYDLTDKAKKLGAGWTAGDVEEILFVAAKAGQPVNTGAHGKNVPMPPPKPANKGVKGGAGKKRAAEDGEEEAPEAKKGKK